MRALVAAILLAACATAQGDTDGGSSAPVTPQQFAIPSAPASGTTDAWPHPALTRVSFTPAPRALSLECAGAFAQGGLALCRTMPGAEVFVDEVSRGQADAQGFFIVGFDRDSPAQSTVRVTLPPNAPSAPTGAVTFVTTTYNIMPREFSIQRVDGLPPETVTPSSPEVIARIAHDRDLKNVGFASRANLEGWLDGFAWPVNGIISGSWGNQRVLNGEPRQPHFGVDIAMPEGTPIKAPAAGVVVLAEPDLYLEGGLVLIDHGQGLISMYLHQSRLDVRAGQRVAQGDQIGLIGMRGRATGPHLCWRMKWRDRNLDPSLAILGLANARTQFAAR